MGPRLVLDPVTSSAKFAKFAPVPLQGPMAREDFRNLLGYRAMSMCVRDDVLMIGDLAVCCDVL